MLTLRKVADQSVVVDRDPMGRPVSPRPLAGVKVVGDAPDEHHFSPKFVTNGMAEGWISIIKGTIILHTVDGDVVYRIVRGPGAYCCHCGIKVGEGPSASRAEVTARSAHAEECCNGTPHPTEWPDGYEVINHYECRLEVASG